MSRQHDEMQQYFFKTCAIKVSIKDAKVLSWINTKMTLIQKIKQGHNMSGYNVSQKKEILSGPDHVPVQPCTVFALYCTLLVLQWIAAFT